MIRIRTPEGNIVEWLGTVEEFLASSQPGKGCTVYTGEWPILTAEPLYVPHDISMRQCWLYLDAMPLINGRNVLDIILEDVVPTLSRRARLEWDARPPVWRSSPMVEQMRLMFGWNVEQMDQMFRDASLL